MFAHVHGEVKIVGTANGPNFDYYRIQIGKGLNPQVWTQIDEDEYKPIKDGILGVWDSSNYSGLFAIQLLVVGKDQRVDRAVMQITVDNEVPELQIISPVMDQVIDIKKQPNLVLNANVQDNLEISRVDFFIDKIQVTSLSVAPFYFSIETTIGKHPLLVKAYDLAGNYSE